MTYEELQWLAIQATTHKVIVEIGVYLGRSTFALGANTPGVVYAIDDFKGPRDVQLPDAIKNNVREIFDYNLGQLINTGHVVAIQADHAKTGIDKQPDMVFLDGSHEYADVRRDIKYWLSRLTKGGLICGHDYTNLQGVQRAVDELVNEPKLAPETSIWHTVKN